LAILQSPSQELSSSNYQSCLRNKSPTSPKRPSLSSLLSNPRRAIASFTTSTKILLTTGETQPISSSRPSTNGDFKFRSTGHLTSRFSSSNPTRLNATPVTLRHALLASPAQAARILTQPTCRSSTKQIKISRTRNASYFSSTIAWHISPSSTSSTSCAAASTPRPNENLTATVLLALHPSSERPKPARLLFAPLAEKPAPANADQDQIFPSVFPITSATFADQNFAPVILSPSIIILLQFQVDFPGKEGESTRAQCTPGVSFSSITQQDSSSQSIKSEPRQTPPSNPSASLNKPSTEPATPSDTPEPTRDHTSRQKRSSEPSKKTDRRLASAAQKPITRMASPKGPSRPSSAKQGL
jgi:hypothetical protein